MNRPPPRGRDWLEATFDSHHARLLAFAARRVGPDDAEDVVAEVFVVAWRRRAAVPDNPLPWLYQVARNVVLHTLRDRGNRRQLAAAAIAVAAPDTPSAENTSAAVVDSILDALDPVDAEILRLTVWEGLTPAEAAVVLDLTPGTARTRLSRARGRAQSLYTRSLTPTS